MDVGPSLHSLDSSRRRVSCPNAAKIGAERKNPATAFGLCCLRKIRPNQLEDRGPSSLVRRECFCAPFEWDSIEARLVDSQHRAFAHLFECEDHQCRGFLGIIDARLDPVRMPPERK